MDACRADFATRPLRIAAGSLLLATLAAQEPEPIELGQRRELFVDRLLIDALDGARLQLAEPRDEGPVMRFDRPWEGPFCGYATVLRDGDRFLLYYRGLPAAGADGTDRERTCVAVSTDGRTWQRPELTFYDLGDGTPNNVVLADSRPACHNFSPFLDTRPGVAAERRFKALGGNEKSGLLAFVSADGMRWSRLQNEPVLRGAEFDSQNVAFYSQHEQCYVSYVRTWTGKGYSGVRTISRSTSKDFVEWTAIEPMQFGDAPLEHLYTNQTHPYIRAPHVYISVCARFLPGRQVLSSEQARQLGVNPRYFRDCSDAVLLTSRGGTRYDRTFLEAFLRPGIGLQNWVSRSNYPALNVVQTGPSEMSFYVNQNYAQPTAELRRYSLRLDGFASLAAGRAGGSMTSKPITFTGTHLLLNFATSAAGSVRIGLQTPDGKTIPGFASSECVPLIGNTIERAVTWRREAGTTSDLTALRGRAVRLRVELVDANLYALQFATAHQAR